MAGVIAEVRAMANDDLEHAVRLLTVELADLKVALAEMRLVYSRPTARRRWSCQIRYRNAPATN
ncbi:MAG TPA: hypothetical protein VGY58_04820 [Gemmataceae bacterium]|jgi:hypothetical protein|nr:hypothetical protein [Gemmataceae bacterium]